MRPSARGKATLADARLEALMQAGAAMCLDGAAMCLDGAARAGMGRAAEGLTQLQRGMEIYQELKTPPVLYWPSSKGWRLKPLRQSVTPY